MDPGSRSGMTPSLKIRAVCPSGPDDAMMRSMSKMIEITDETAAALAKLSAATGRAPSDLLSDAVSLEARRADLKATLARRLTEQSAPVDGESVIAALREKHASRSA